MKYMVTAVTFSRQRQNTEIKLINSNPNWFRFDLVQGRSASGAMGLIANPPGPVKNKLLSQNWRLDPFKL